MNVKSLLPTNAHVNVKNETKALISKWERTGLLEGFSNETEQSGMAVLLENQAN